MTSTLRDRTSTFTRRDDIALLLPDGGIGVELGVAQGMFSEKILRRSNLAHLYSIDMWAGDRHHTSEEYKQAIKRLTPYRDRNTIIRLRFDEALDLFPDDYFDFIYVDGYAHTGEEEGKTFQDWYPKLKAGGIFAGDDYHSDWPLVVEHVNNFSSRNHLDVCLIVSSTADDPWSAYPTWFAQKI